MNPIKGMISDYHKEDKTARQEAFKKLKEAFTPESTMTDEEKESYAKGISDKIKRGKKLTQSELNYIRRTDPVMYLHVKRVQIQREMLEKRITNCKSKKEVEEAYNQAITSIGEKDPDKEALISAYDDVMVEFKKTSKYKSLPFKLEEEKGEKQCNEAIEINIREWDEMEESSFDRKA